MATLARQSIQLENPTIGGRNYWIQSSFALDSYKAANNSAVGERVPGWWKDPKPYVVSDSSGNYMKIKPAASWDCGQYFDFIDGEQWTISFEARAGNADLVGKKVAVNTDVMNVKGYQIGELTTNWKRYSFVLTAIGTGEERIHIRCLTGTATTDDELHIRKIKLEKGTKATDWTPAPEDKADQAIIDNWTSDAIKDGVTKINGGYIQTQTINSSHLIVEDIFATGSAAMNLISARELNADLITSGTINANFLSLYGMQVLNKTTNQQTLNITENGEITLRGSVESYNYNDGKTGWAIKQNGDAEFNDVVVRGSVITNDGGIVSSGGSGRNLLLNSYSNKTNGSTSYPCGTYTLARKVTAGEKYTFSVNAEFTGATILALYFGGGSYGTQWVNVPGNGTHTISFSFTANSNMAAQSVAYLYVRDAQNQASFTQGSCKIVWAKLEEGSVATAWSPAPEDNLKQVRFWAGSSFDERDDAPFIVYNDGSIKATRGEYSGLWTGDVQVGNVTITDPSSTSGNDANITVVNGSSGVQAIQLTDRDTSIFRQAISVRTAAKDSTTEMIALKPDGSGIFNSVVQVGSGASASQLKNDQLVIRGNVLTYNTNGFEVRNKLTVGSASASHDMQAYGDIYSMRTLKTEDGVVFATNDVSKAQIKKVANGLDIDIT